MFFGPSWLICRASAGRRCHRSARSCRQGDLASRWFLDPRAALGPDGAVVFAARQDLLCRIGYSGQSVPRCGCREMRGLVREEIDAAALGCDFACTSIGAAVGRQTLRMTSRRQDTIEVDFGLAGDQVSRAILADLQPVDL